MKKISVKCYSTGYAAVTTSDLSIENENAATQLEIDYAVTDYSAEPKWVDLVMSDGTSLRYELGTDPVVTLDLLYPTMIRGEMIITPFVYNGTLKEKWKTNASVVIHEQKEAGTSDAAQRDDYIFELKEQAAKFKKLVTLAEGGSINLDTLINYEFLHIQVHESISGRTVPIYLKIRTDIANIVIKEKLLDSPESYAILEQAAGSITFDVYNAAGAVARAGAIADIYGIYMREET
jgi:hypothetical protein